jgi:Immunity protein 26
MKLADKHLSEGAIFAVPLLDSGYALCVVARRRPGRGNGKVLFGYFFGPRKLGVPNKIAVAQLQPEDSIARICFGGLRIRLGEWPLIGSVDNFVRSDWQMPPFSRISPLNSDHAWLDRYRDDYPDGPVDETRVSPEVARQFPTHRMYGADAAAAFITEMIVHSER